MPNNNDIKDLSLEELQKLYAKQEAEKAKLQKEVDAKKKSDSAEVDENKKLAAELEASQKEKTRLELANQESAAALEIANDEKEAALQALETEKTKSVNLEALRNEVTSVTSAQNKYFEKTFDTTVKHNAKVKTKSKGGKTIEVGFLPGIHKIRIPGFNTHYVNKRNKQGEIVERIPFMTAQREISIDMLIQYAPEEIQKLWDKKVDIFKDLESGESYFGKKAQSAVNIEVEV